jgi:quinol monooxygenase YgiN
MIISQLIIKPPSSKKNEALDLLQYVLEPTRVAPGCLFCSLYEESGSDEILYLERWRSREELYEHIKSSSYITVLTAMELSAVTPKVTVIEALETDGMKLINELRST